MGKYPTQDWHSEVFLKKEFFEVLFSGLKTIEMPVKPSGSLSRIDIGCKIIFKSENGESIGVEITDISRYQKVGVSHILATGFYSIGGRKTFLTFGISIEM